MDALIDILQDACVDTLKLIPFLFVTYLAMEALEHRAGDKAEEAVRNAGRFGPLVGALLGALPQCGFSSAGATLYAGRVVSLGTLFAVFLATSDEMLPVMIAEQVPVSFMLEVVGIKVVIGMLMGFAIDAAVRVGHRSGDGHMHIHELCEEDKCGCGEEHGGIWRSALHHTLEVTLFIFLITLVLDGIIDLAGEETIASFLAINPTLSVVGASLVGLIPNCAASVVITELYLDGALSAGAMIGGLLTSAGVGLLVLLRTNRNPRENIGILLGLLVIGIVFGSIFSWAGFTL